MLAHGLMRGYGRRRISPRCALKVDLQKAFDSLHWSFLLSVLRAQVFPEKFLKWIEICLTTHQFSVSLNGSFVGFFRGRIGIRQGDPFSPYLLVLAMDVLYRLLDVVVINAFFKYHPTCLRVWLTHLMFADDLLIFSKGTVDSMRNKRYFGASFLTEDDILVQVKEIV
ncbi:LINE-1 retrotransposable element ORF2 protein [Gossypium australe]|uniref:LINE-1 retrotransposable element ORF2 protein n=1 Tax=Gossypium australe TaxID=47621 RepID=A0A5B6WNF8_9ROSI|nr:LINE-1 retrotransposable element ORF2 protein [Gossypium australe]